MADYYQLDIEVKNEQSPINVITFSKSLNFVALGRDNGIVEIYDMSQNFLLLAKIIVSNKNPIDGLKFMDFAGIKLFGISSSTLFEIDLNKNYIKQEILFLSNHCARSIIMANDKIVVGCDGGYIHLYEYISEIRFLRTIHNAGESILSLAYNKSMSKYLFAGSQGRLYRIDTISNNSDYFDLINEKNKSPTFIWCMAFVGNYLCTGDSKGNVTIWDPENLGIIQTFTTHKADILTITTGINCLYASGSDPKIVKLELVGDLWKETLQRYGIIGDVRSLCTADTNLIAGGLNCELVMYDINNKYNGQLNKYKKIDNVPVHNEIHLFNDRYILFTENSNRISIYEVSRKPAYKKLLRTVLVAGHLQAWSVSKCLNYLSYSINNKTTILKMQFNVNDNKTTVGLKRFSASEYFTNPIRAEGEPIILPASYILQFVQMNDRTLLICVESFKSDNNSKLFIYEITPDCLTPTLITTILPKEENNFNQVHQIETSSDGKTMAFSTLDGLLFIYSIEKLMIVKKIVRPINPNGNEGQPRVLCMKFNSDGKRLFVIFTNKKLLQVDLLQKKPSKWCNVFNTHIRKEWSNLSPRKIEYLTDDKWLILCDSKLAVTIDMDKQSIVPANVPLFVKKKFAKISKERSINMDLIKEQKNLNKMKRILEDPKFQNRPEAMKGYEKRAATYQKRIDNLQSLEVDPTIETCFKWDFLVNDDTMTIKYIPEEKRIVSISRQQVDIPGCTYKKKFFGV